METVMRLIRSAGIDPVEAAMTAIRRGGVSAPAGMYVRKACPDTGIVSADETRTEEVPNSARIQQVGAEDIPGDGQVGANTLSYSARFPFRRCPQSHASSDRHTVTSEEAVMISVHEDAPKRGYAPSSRFPFRRSGRPGGGEDNVRAPSGDRGAPSVSAYDPAQTDAALPRRARTSGGADRIHADPADPGALSVTEIRAELGDAPGQVHARLRFSNDNGPVLDGLFLLDLRPCAACRVVGMRFARSIEFRPKYPGDGDLLPTESAAGSAARLLKRYAPFERFPKAERLAERAGLQLLAADIGTDGALFLSPGDISAPGTAAVRPGLTPARRAFTIAHELAHFLLHRHFLLAALALRGTTAADEGASHPAVYTQIHVRDGSATDVTTDATADVSPSDSPTVRQAYTKIAHSLPLTAVPSPVTPVRPSLPDARARRAEAMTEVRVAVDSLPAPPDETPRIPVDLFLSDSSVVRRMEAQADALAAELLLPRRSVLRVVRDELARLGITEPTHADAVSRFRFPDGLPTEALARALTALRAACGLPLSCARARLVSLGLPAADGILRNVNGRPVPDHGCAGAWAEGVTYVVPFARLVALKQRSPSLRAYITDGYLYVEGHLCRPDGLCRDRCGHARLTAEARRAVDRFCLPFRVERVPVPPAVTHGRAARGGTSFRTEYRFDTPHPEREIRRFRADTRRLAELRSLSVEGFGPALRAVLEHTGITQQELSLRLGCDRKTIWRMLNNDMPPLDHIIAACVVLDLPPFAALALVSSAGYALRSSELHLLYEGFLENAAALTLADCNAILADAGYPPMMRQREA